MDRVGAEEAAAVVVRRQAVRVNQAAQGQSPVWAKASLAVENISRRSNSLSASNRYVLNYHRTGFDEECERSRLTQGNLHFNDATFIRGSFPIQQNLPPIIWRGRKFAISFRIHWRWEQALLPWKPEEKGNNR
ncbi:hypothetical protein OPV22_004774 [Ensete ventricosum]|uniref:Uncharacterized protein n=1 Tax=Ensete ventricosum TaxID=4639 RepID=A0AAV8RLB6_ENSVE|nr:hypothetical protein OPV22_004774 [Ensete ventricosum]